MTSGKVQLSENAAIEFCRNLAGKIRKFLGIVCIGTTSGKLPEDRVFSHSSKLKALQENLASFEMMTEWVDAADVPPPHAFVTAF